MRVLIVAVAMVAALVGCGPSAAQVHAARSAQYRASPAVLLDATIAALRAHRYVIAGVDPVAGTVQTEPIWFSNMGTKRRSGRVRAVDRDVRFAIRARVEPRAEGTFGITLEAIAARAHSGLHELVPIDPQDADVPSWFGPRLDDVYLDVYARGCAAASSPRRRRASRR
ncbi:MAG: hypothetical protein JNK64_09275 [Myxococcales bacterium]|nr:hypothetical protein [Myxococcales bacterium]